MPSEFYDNGRTVSECPTHVSDSSRFVQPPRGLPVPWASLKDTLDNIGGTKAETYSDELQ